MNLARDDAPYFIKYMCRRNVLCDSSVTGRITPSVGDQSRQHSVHFSTLPRGVVRRTQAPEQTLKRKLLRHESVDCDPASYMYNDISFQHEKHVHQFCLDISHQYSFVYQLIYFGLIVCRENAYVQRPLAPH